jgi:hypothetical protein
VGEGKEKKLLHLTPAREEKEKSLPISLQQGRRKKKVFPFHSSKGGERKKSSHFTPARMWKEKRRLYLLLASNMWEGKRASPTYSPPLTGGAGEGDS